jgi:hypothetical protein
MTILELRHLYKHNNPEGHFFDRKTMSFFGDTMSNFGVRDGGEIKTLTEKGVENAEVWELYRKRPVKNGLHGRCRYFSKSTGRQIFTHCE